MLLINISCNRNTSEFIWADFSSQWRSSAIDLYLRNNRFYERDILVNCFDSNRSQYFDMERKIRAINNTDIGKTIKGVSEELTKSRNRTDSILLRTILSPYNEELNSGFPTTNIFYLYSKDTITGKISCLLDVTTNKMSFKVVWDNNIKFEIPKTGCGYGFEIFTLIRDKFNTWEIKSVVINPDSTM